MTTPKQSQNLPDLKILFIHQLNRVNCTKGYLIRNLPILEEIASFKNMKLAIQEDLDDVKKQQVRIDKMYSMLHSKASDEGCDVIKSVIEEAFNLGNNAGKSTIVNDMDIILYMQTLYNILLQRYLFTLHIISVMHIRMNIEKSKEEFYSSNSYITSRRIKLK